MEKRKNETIELLMKRKSMRVFEDKPVPQDVKGSFWKRPCVPRRLEI